MNIEKTITLNNGHRIMRAFLIGFFIFNAPFCKAQKKRIFKEKNSMNCCYDYLLNSLKITSDNAIGNFRSTFPTSSYKFEVIGNHLAISSEHKRAVVLISKDDNISEWNDVIDWSKIKYSIAKTSNCDILIAIAPVAGASGLETNFYKYLLINLKSGEFKIIQSLSNNNRFIYNNRGKLELYIFDYSSMFLKERNYDNISLNIKKYQFNGKTLIQLGQNDKVCDCRINPPV